MSDLNCKGVVFQIRDGAGIIYLRYMGAHWNVIHAEKTKETITEFIMDVMGKMGIILLSMDLCEFVLVISFY